MECTVCHIGSTEPGKVTVTLERDAAIVLIKDVPAQVCVNCGHYYLSEEIATLIMQKGHEAISSGAELEIVRLKVAS